VTASKLLTMAVNYLAAEDKVAARFTRTVDTSSYAKPPQPDCEEQKLEAELPMVTHARTRATDGPTRPAANVVETGGASVAHGRPPR